MSRYRLDGVYLSPKMAFLLVRHGALQRVREQYKRHDPDLDEFMGDVREVAEQFAGSLNGSPPRKNTEAAPALKQWVTPREASRQLNITEHAVRLAIREGRLPALKNDGRWQIAAADLHIHRTA